MSARRKAGIWALLTLVFVAVQHAFGWYVPEIDTFNQTVLGRFIPAILASGLFIPNARSYFAELPRMRRVRSLLAEWHSRAIDGRPLDDSKAKASFLKLFREMGVTKRIVEQAEPDEAAVLLLGLQYYHAEITLEESLELFDVSELATKAAVSAQYKEILLATSLSAALFAPSNAQKLAVRMLDRAAGTIRVRYRSEDEDQKFFDQLAKARDERIYIFSTTSQISEASLNLLREHTGQVEVVNFFLVSPLIESDTAIAELQKEYDVPQCAIPPAQFVPDRTSDSIRRILRVLFALDAMMAFQKATGMGLQVWLFREKYPSLKIRILQKKSYMQILPGSLKYVNNLYRFGLEVKETELIEPIVDVVERWMKDENLTRRIDLNEVELGRIRDRSLREAARFFLCSGQPIEKLEEFRPKFRFVLQNPRTDAYLDSIVGLVKAAHETIMHHNLSTPPRQVETKKRYHSEVADPRSRIVVHTLQGGKAQHISVGVMFMRDNREILLIEKATSPNVGRYSIIAGHIEEGETAIDAVQREVSEELGIVLDMTHCELMRHYADIPGDMCRHGVYHHEWFIFVTKQIIHESDIRISEEIIKASWVSLDAIGKLQLTYASKQIFGDLGVL